MLEDEAAGDEASDIVLGNEEWYNARRYHSLDYPTREIKWAANVC